MKKGLFLIPVLATFLVVFGGCGDKDNDFRDTWLGTYEGYCEYHSSTGSDHQFDTVYSDQSLIVSKQGNEGLVMDYLGQSFQVRCSSDGTFTSTSNNPHSESKVIAYSFTTKMSRKAIPPPAISKEKRNKRTYINYLGGEFLSKTFCRQIR